MSGLVWFLMFFSLTMRATKKLIHGAAVTHIGRSWGLIQTEAGGSDTDGSWVLIQTVHGASIRQAPGPWTVVRPPLG